MAQNSKDLGRKRLDVKIDRISNLPEPIICHILSFLPTRDAVKTTLLSPKFLNLWKNITTLSFSHHAQHKPAMKFVNFVNRVFLLLETKCIDKLCFELPGFDESNKWKIKDNLSNWIAAAVAKNVKSLSLLMNGFDTVPWFRLPSCVFTCNALETLELSNVVVALYRSSLVRLPNLRILRMEDNACSIRDECRIVSGCSSLHTLYLRRHESEGHESEVGFSVCSPTLEHLAVISGLNSDFDFDSDSDSDSDSEDNEEPWRIKLDAPALKYLHLKLTKLKYLSMKTSSPLIEADISLGAAKCESSTFDNLIQALSNVKLLVLDVSEACLKAGAHSRLLPMFSNLTSLTLHNFFGEFNFVKELLQKSPKLETLDLKCINFRRSNGFSEPNLIPRYRSPCLEIVKVNNFYGSKDQLKLLSYILSNASVLKTMKIMTHRNCQRKHQLLQEISKFWRMSQYCSIEFD